MELPDLDISFNLDGWGPGNGDKITAFDNVPYAQFDKKEKCWRAADFSTTTSSFAKPRQRRGDDSAVNAEFAYKHDAVEDSTFRLVDTQSKSKYGNNNVKRTWAPANRTGRFPGRGSNQAGRGLGRPDPVTSAGRAARSRATKNRPTNRGYVGKNRRNDRNKMDRVASLTVKGDWEVLEEIDFPQLQKLIANLPKVTDLLMCGHLDQYDDTYDKLTTKIARPLRRIENKIFYSVNTVDDPILEKFAVERVGNVFATDAIIGQLMAAPRSVYSWDIVIEKMDGLIFLDKRDNSFDLLTVSETSHEPPLANDETEEINHPEKLSVEATIINQNFSQQVLREDLETRKTFEQNPFHDDTSGQGEAASVAYKYRKFTLGTIELVVRCELHGWTAKRSEDLTMTCHALNEWDSKYSGGVDWRQKIDQQRSAVLATELKNNSCKMAKWTAESILAGADLLKLGYVSRVSKNNNFEHTILTTQFFKPKELANQIAMQMQNMWGIIKMICDLVMSQEDGKFVLLKDPNRPMLRLYSVPLSSFESEDEEEADEYEGEDRKDDVEVN